MPIKYLKWITRDMLQKEPEARFVFGDNTQREGLGGQAKEMRYERNAIGIVTKWKPTNEESAFFSDLAFGTGPHFLIVQDLKRVQQALKEGRVVYAPFDGLGTGLSQLPERAPRLYNMIVTSFRSFPGEECPWPLIEGVEPMGWAR